MSTSRPPLPEPSDPTPDKPVVRVVTAEIRRDGSWLLVQRPPHAVLPLLWEFPGGRVREGESDRDALMRALDLRIGVAATVGERVLEIRHDYGDYSVVLAVYRAEIGSAEIVARTVHAHAWVAPEDFDDYPFPPADQRTVELLLKDRDATDC